MSVKFGCQLLVIVILILSGFSTAALQSQESSAPAADERPLKKPLAAFQSLIGTWEIDGQWTGGQPLWARNEYRAGMNGNFVEAKTWAKNENGRIYQRYLTIWRHNEEAGTVQSHGFIYDGGYQLVDTSIETPDGEHPVISSQWQTETDGPWYRQRVQLTSEDQYTWKVWSSPDGGQWDLIMDGVWKRVNR